MLHAPVMDIAADELLETLARIEATLTEVVQRAGDGGTPDLERRLEAHLRSLRPLLDDACLAVAGDVIDAARQALAAPDPAPQLLLLASARQTLGALIRRVASQRPLRPAA